MKTTVMLGVPQTGTGRAGSIDSNVKHIVIFKTNTVGGTKTRLSTGRFIWKTYNAVEVADICRVHRGGHVADSVCAHAAYVADFAYADEIGAGAEDLTGRAFVYEVPDAQWADIIARRLNGYSNYCNGVEWAAFPAVAP